MRRPITADEVRAVLTVLDTGTRADAAAAATGRNADDIREAAHRLGLGAAWVHALAVGQVARAMKGGQKLPHGRVQLESVRLFREERLSTDEIAIAMRVPAWHVRRLLKAAREDHDDAPHL